MQLGQVDRANREATYECNPREEIVFPTTTSRVIELIKDLTRLS
jgi:hypothetical protein